MGGIISGRSRKPRCGAKLRGMSSVLQSLPQDASWFPHSTEARSDTVNLVHVSRLELEQASFLDERLLTSQIKGLQVSWKEILGALDGKLPERCHYIFHIGHVGSTLLSRLMGSHRAALSLRDPLILRNFAQLAAESVPPEGFRGADFETRLASTVQLLSRTFKQGEVSIIKATSFVSELAARLMSRPASPHAVMVFVSPESYLASIFSGPTSRQEAKIHLRARLARL